MTIAFRTARLVARRLVDTDVDELLAVYGDVEAMRWVDDGRAITRQECVAWLGVTRENYARRGYGMWALELGEGGPVVGFLGLVHPGGQERAEVKYALGREHWGRGLASEAVAGAVRYAARERQLLEVIATLSPENQASRRVLEKAGFVEESTTRDPDGSAVLLMRRDLSPGASPVD